FQMLKTADELTLSHTGKNYELYDEKGKICLREWKNIPTTKNVINYDGTQDFEYTTDIDSVYNRIKVNYVDDEDKSTETFVSEDENHIKKWGRLQYYVETSTKMQLKERADTLLKLLNRKHRALTIQSAVGDFQVRGGSLVPVYFPFLGDIHVNSLMLVNKVTHHIRGSHHFMDLEVYNKDILPTLSGAGLFEGAQSKQKAEVADPALGGGALPGGVDRMVQAGKGKIGSHYRRGAAGPNTFDCSGFVTWCAIQAGLMPPGSRIASGNMDSRYVHKISWSDIRPGDIVHFSGNPGHVALYLGDGQVLECGGRSSSKLGYSGVAITPMDKRNHKFKNVYRLNKLG
ncbi:MAG: NlpC/P60 family protein, partial [Peptoniphilus sp.]